TENGTTWKPASPMELQMLDQQKMFTAASAGGREVVLAARVRGPFETNYPDGLTVWESADGDDAQTSRTLESVQQSNDEAAVVVFADADFITDQMAYERIFFGTAVVGDNAATVFNALDFLGGSTELTEIRSRGRYERPFT